MNPHALEPQGTKFPRLLYCGDAAVDSGATLIVVATSGASFLQTPDCAAPDLPAENKSVRLS